MGLHSDPETVIQFYDYDTVEPTMADAEALKRRRITEKSGFTRSVTALLKMIRIQSCAAIVDEQLAKVKKCYDVLEKTHNEFMLAAVDIDLETSVDGIPYMVDSDEKLDDAIVKYTEYQKEERQRVSEDQRALAEQDAARKKTVREEKERDEQQSVAAARRAESERQLEAEKMQLKACVQSFKRMSTSVNIRTLYPSMCSILFQVRS